MRAVITALLLIPMFTAAAPADLVLRGGQVLTMDDELGTRSAVAVTGARISWVGDAAGAGAHIGERTTVIDLDGRTVMPGLIEGHGHFLSFGRAQQILDLTTTVSYADIVAMVARAADQAEPGDWVYGRGWHQDKWTHVPEGSVDGVPRNTDLGRVAPDNPVILGHASGHAVFVNDAALAAAGVTDETLDPAGGTIVRDNHGRATGLLRETAEALVRRVATEANEVPEVLERLRREQVLLAGRAALRHGVTSFHDAGSSFDEIDFLRRVEAERALPVRLHVMIGDATPAQLAEKLPAYLQPYEEADFLTVRGIKQVLDGALGSHGAWLLEPYVDLATTTGLQIVPTADLEAVARLAVAHGYQLNTHAIGPRANREALDVYERVWREAQIDGKSLRWRIEHAQHVHPDDVPRFGRLGVIAAVQGVHGTSDGPWLASRLGRERAERTSYRWRDLLDTGARIGNGTDVPVEPITPFASIQSSVAAYFEAQAMTRMEALKSYTIDNAYAAFEEDVKGSITAGKLADLIVLDADPLRVPIEALGDIDVELTVLGGEVRYRAPASLDR